MYAKVNALQAVRHRGNLSKPVTLRATDSGVQNAWRSFETIAPAGKRSETDYLEDSVSGAGGRCGAHHTASYKLPHRDKKGLPTIANPVYGYSAPAKSGAGIGVPVIIRAHNTRHACFFVPRSYTPSMVDCMGAEQSAPVSLIPGYANPVQFTTSEIGVSGGGYQDHESEAAAMLATTPTQNPQFIWLIAAVRRDMPTITAKIHHIAAETEQEARRILARDHVCFFAGRIRTGGAHA
ncbi:host cell division inhibitor Icd-like protein [Klebsiella michiganensis]|uniref:host cell division inhibitor Icd-like protein n=3 Tax=Enterobacteriaceae TaxID=543 RepID=UPI001D0DD4E8|nr:host cell division inhibitor Icd-like protein [Klebsiella michiganensis]MCS6054871.1 host cell division inhibitor Icd-like protein [Klebsiella variicola subsp. variicola]MCW9455101.1 host cell division inhibitor Icd-like protein [Klebsiella michiganensis]